MKPAEILLLYVKSCTKWIVETELRFHPVRKWRFDIAVPGKMVAFEYEGGIFTKGAHTRGAHYASDAEKYNQATLMGWRVFRLTSKDFRTRGGIPNLKESACQMIKKALV